MMQYSCKIDKGVIICILPPNTFKLPYSVPACILNVTYCQKKYIYCSFLLLIYALGLASREGARLHFLLQNNQETYETFQTNERDAFVSQCWVSVHTFQSICSNKSGISYFHVKYLLILI